MSSYTAVRFSAAKTRKEERHVVAAHCEGEYGVDWLKCTMMVILKGKKANKIMKIFSEKVYHVFRCWNAFP